MRSLCLLSWISLSLVFWVLETSAQEPATDEPYEALEELLETLQPREQVEAIEDYLARYPQSSYSTELRDRLASLRLDVLDAQRPTLPALSPEPFSFFSMDGDHLTCVSLELGAPAWSAFELTYLHRLSEEWLLSGHAGAAEGQKFLSASGLYNLLRTPRNEGRLAVRLETLAVLGQDSHLRFDPAVAYRFGLGKLVWSISTSARVRLMRLPATRLESGIAVGWSLRPRLWLSLESWSFMKRIDAIRTDYPTPVPIWVGFSTFLLGVRYTLSSQFTLEGWASIPDVEWYQKDYSIAMGLGIRYRLP